MFDEEWKDLADRVGGHAQNYIDGLDPAGGRRGR